ncbi:MAG TPA: hypothetical protein VGB37_12770 [Candidatus Lokiarchaeia archaeon]
MKEKQIEEIEKEIKEELEKGIKRNKDKVKSEHKRWKENNRDKIKAQQGIYRAKARNELKSAKEYKCFNCINQAEEYHHPDYNKPFTIIPLCKNCHILVHRNLNEKMWEQDRINSEKEKMEMLKGHKKDMEFYLNKGKEQREKEIYEDKIKFLEKINIILNEELKSQIQGEK